MALWRHFSDWICWNGVNCYLEKENKLLWPSATTEHRSQKTTLIASCCGQPHHPERRRVAPTERGAPRPTGRGAWPPWPTQVHHPGVSIQSSREYFFGRLRHRQRQRQGSSTPPIVCPRNKPFVAVAARMSTQPMHPCSVKITIIPTLC